MDEAAVAASATTSRPALNIGFFTSPSGWLKMSEIVLGILVFALIAGNHYPCWSNGTEYCPPFQFVMFVSITCWILTLALSVIYILGIQYTTFSGAPWDVIEFVFNAVWTVFYGIASIVAAANVKQGGDFVAATVFAFFITAVYAVHALYALKLWRGELPCMSSPSTTGTNVNT